MSLINPSDLNVMNTGMGGMYGAAIPGMNNEVMGLAKKIASKGPLAVKKVKKVARAGINMDFDAGSELESVEFGSLFGNEGEEGMKAFLEKRAPNW